MEYYTALDQAALHEALAMMAELWSGTYVLGNPRALVETELAWHPDFQRVGAA